MKRIFITVCFFLIASISFSQTFQATVKAGSLPNSIIVAVKPSADVTNAKISSLYFTIAVAASVSPRPALSILTNFNPNIGYTINALPATEMIAGVPFYIYNFLGDGQTGSGTEKNYTAGIDNNMAELVFQNGPISPAASVLLVNLPDGGISQNSFFDIFSTGTDVTNETAMFYGGSPVNSAAGFSGLSYTSVSNITLPVKFLDFSASKKDNNAVLSWLIENESTQTDRYEIERSLNGTDFTKVNTVTAKNNGKSSNSYNLTDLNLTSLHAAGIIYYRIKQIDKDGLFIYSTTKNLRLAAKPIAISIYPNPVKNDANISIDLEENTKAIITIIDGEGKQLKNIETQLFKGLNVKKISMASMAAGSYLLKIETPMETKTISVVKAN